MKRWRWRLAILAAALLLTPVLAALLLDSNALREPVAGAISKSTGRSFAIDGELDVVWGWPPRLRMEDVRFANPEWAVEAQALQVEELEVAVSVWFLLIGRIVIPHAHLVRPVVAIERDAQGKSNWDLGRDDEAGDPKRPPVIGELRVADGLILFHHPAQDTMLRVRLQTVAATDAAPATLRFQAKGQVKGKPAELAGSGGSILSIADREASYPFDLRFAIGPSRGHLEGQITSLAALTAADIRLDIRGDSMADAFPLLQLPLPPTPPYALTGRLQREAKVWRLMDFEGRFGDSDIAGDAELDSAGERRRIQARLVSRQLDLDDLAGIIGGTPQTGSGETASAEQVAEAKAAKARPTLLPDRRLNFAQLRRVDGDLRFQARSIRGHRLPLEDVSLHAKLADGVLRFQPLNFGVAGGDVLTRMAIDTNGERLDVDGDIQFRRIDLRRLFPASAIARSNSGLIGGRMRIQAKGRSFAELMAHADGSIGLVSSGGRVSNLALELIGLDAAEVLRFLFRGDKTVRLRCAVADLEMQQGVLRTRSFIVDTSDTRLQVSGTINLRDETLDLKLQPLPKDFSLATVRAPLHIKGRLKKPELELDKQVAMRGGLAAVLGAIAGPVAALLPLIETGPGDNADCRELMAAAQRSTGATPP